MRAVRVGAISAGQLVASVSAAFNETVTTS
jgi:hypothetical protein